MSFAHLPSPLAALRHLDRDELRYQASHVLSAILFHLAGGTALLTLAITAYVAKRALGLDIVPGVDMLPDAEIENALAGLAALFGG
ncbi:hypothetical protein [Roseicella aquatilis]|uniref:Uncharacterized protein n=1 Tax=Roseicella aquatilis TaxID=2527868 RepID=A0A4R4DFN7_9PROT|nr:hypothetical protein [Roseicella aquatilis]TCZ59717.1 hypothetical protein EXY23_15475 [Roseicella aquatilis]